MDGESTLLVSGVLLIIAGSFMLWGAPALIAGGSLLLFVGLWAALS